MTLRKHNGGNWAQGLLLRTLLSVVCLFFAAFAGCTQEPGTIATQPQQERTTRPIETTDSADSAVTKAELQLSTEEDLLVHAAPVVLEPEPHSDRPANNFEASESDVPKVREINIPAAVEAQAGPDEATAQEVDAPAADEELLPSETLVNLPLLDKPGMADELISVNFDQVDIRIMLKTIGDITGINFVVDDNVKGTVTVMSPTKIRLADVYKMLESVLEVKGYAAVPAGNLVKIVPRAEAARRNLLVRIGSDPSQIPISDSIVTQIIPLNYADATEVSRIITPLLTTGSHLATYPRTNSVLITDTSSNIHHVARIIQKLDVRGSKEQVTVISLEFASAEVLSEQITKIMEKSRTASPSGRNHGAGQIDTGIRIVPNTRTNRLVVIANARDTAKIEKLVAELDIQRPNRANNVHVVYLKNAPAKETAKSLTEALGNLRGSGALETGRQVQVTADEGTNALIITASAQDYEVISEITEKLDIVREQVLVEMFIMEVTEETLKEIGIDWATLDQAITGSARFFAQTNFGPRVDFAGGDLEGLSIGAWRKTGSTTNIGSILTALEKKSGVNILSTPHITTSNHNKARIIVGENRAFVTESRITESDPATPTVIKAFEYQDVGISLEITPHISQGGLVRLEIESEFTKLITDVTAPSSYTPTRAKRQAQTVVSMMGGSTIVIGGLIRDDKVTLEKKIPLLGDIPILGGLFRYKKDQLEKTNLLIFITPYVLSTPDDLQRIREKKEKEMEQATKDLSIKKDE